MVVRWAKNEGGNPGFRPQCICYDCEYLLLRIVCCGRRSWFGKQGFYVVFQAVAKARAKPFETAPDGFDAENEQGKQKYRSPGNAVPIVPGLAVVAGFHVSVVCADFRHWFPLLWLTPLFSPKTISVRGKQSQGVWGFSTACQQATLCPPEAPSGGMSSAQRGRACAQRV